MRRRTRWKRKRALISFLVYLFLFVAFYFLNRYVVSLYYLQLPLTYPDPALAVPSARRAYTGTVTKVADSDTLTVKTKEMEQK